MRIVIIGGSGLIGHKLWEKLSARFEDVYTVVHRKKSDLAEFCLFDSDKVIDNLDVTDFSHLEGVLHAINPDVVLNCVGITKRKPEINDFKYALTVNSLYPHKLAEWTMNNGKRMIHFSTDCVFNGSEGNYTEESLTTAEDTYGRTKAFGEVRYPGTLTIRSSFIGRELEGKTELLEWFLAQAGKTIKGFHKAFYSGVSTSFMCDVVGDIILNHPDLSGLYQLATDTPISKFDLLHIAKSAFDLDVNILPESDFININTLRGDKLREILGYSAPPWELMMENIASEGLYTKVGKGK